MRAPYRQSLPGSNVGPLFRSSAIRFRAQEIVNTGLRHRPPAFAVYMNLISSSETRMPKFFFNVDEERPDAVGVDFPDRKTARGEAIRAAGEILRDIDGAFTGQEWKMVVRDERGEVVLELRFSVTERVAS
jgi:hypothetical protein